MFSMFTFVADTAVKEDPFLQIQTIAGIRILWVADATLEEDVRLESGEHRVAVYTV